MHAVAVSNRPDCIARLLPALNALSSVYLSVALPVYPLDLEVLPSSVVSLVSWVVSHAVSLLPKQTGAIVSSNQNVSRFVTPSDEESPPRDLAPPSGSSLSRR